MSNKSANILVFLVLFVLSLAIFSNSMTKPVGHDEQMYCTGGVMLAQGKMIYRDFSYVAQMPYHPLICAALFKVLNTTYYLLVCRMFSVVCDILVAVCIIGIYRRIFKSSQMAGSLLGLAAVALYVFNPVVDYANGYAWNHDFVILCVMGSFWLFTATDFQHKSRYWRTAVIGALLTVATFTRITTVLVQLLFLLVLFAQPAESAKQRFKTAAAFLVGTVVVSIWPVWVILQARQAFFLNIFEIPMLNGQWLSQTGRVHDKAFLTFVCLKTPAYLVVMAIGTWLWVVFLLRRGKLNAVTRINALFALLLPLTFFLIALIPVTMWRQYLAVPVPFLVVSFAYPLVCLRMLCEQRGSYRHFKAVSAALTGAVVVAVVSWPIVLGRIPQLFDLEQWTALGVHKISEDIATKTKSPKRVLTLAPLYAIEGGCDIYTELSAGAFVYRIADKMTETDRNIANAVGPGTLRELLDKSPASAVVLGAEWKDLEDPLFQTAVMPDRQRWERKVYEGGLEVYFRR